MKKSLICLFLIITTTSKLRIDKETFTGCESEIFKFSTNYRILKIDFSKSCSLFEKCIQDRLFTRKQCLDSFVSNMKDFCKTYTRFDFWRRRYCLRIVEKNQIIADALDENLFKKATFKYFANILHEIQTNAYCIVVDDDPLQVCKYDDERQVFSFFYLDDLDRWIIKNYENNCLDKNANWFECDFGNNRFYMEFIFEGILNKGRLYIKNIDGKYFKQTDNTTPLTFSDTKDNTNNFFLLVADE